LNNLEVCLDDAEAHNLMSPEEIEQARLIGPLLREGKTPGQCKSETECDEYCNNEANLEECVNFAVMIGEIDPEEAEQIIKTGGHGPGGCRGKEECDAFCKDENNLNECIDFAVQYGFISAEEAEIVRKTGFSGPGGCQGKEECDAFCNDPANQMTCFQFGVEHGLVDPEEGKLIMEIGSTDREKVDAFCKASEENMAKCTSTWPSYGKGEGEKGNDYSSLNPPGGCSYDDEACLSAYCSQGANWEECAEYDMQLGHMTQEDLDRRRSENEQAAQAEIDKYEELVRQREMEESFNEPEGTGGGDTGGETGGEIGGGDTGGGDTGGGDTGGGDTGGGDTGGGDTGGGEGTGMAVRDIENDFDFLEFLIGI
jgi:uncharacterized protein YlaN (UPF0358 family)